MPIKFEVRQAAYDDLNDIASLFKKHCEYNEEEGWNSNYNLDWALSEEGAKFFKDFLGDKNDHVAFVALNEDKAIVGYLLGLITSASHRTDNPVGVIDNLYIDAGYRCSGIGSALMEDFTFWCKEHSAKRIRVETYFDNQHARNIYEKEGFEEQSVIYETAID